MRISEVLEAVENCNVRISLVSEAVGNCNVRIPLVLEAFESCNVRISIGFGHVAIFFFDNIRENQLQCAYFHWFWTCRHFILRQNNGKLGYIIQTNI